MLGAAASTAYRVMPDMMDHQHAGTAAASLVATGALGCCVSLAASRYYIAVTNGASSSHSGRAVGTAGSDADGSQGQESVQLQQMLQRPPAALLNLAQKLHDLLMTVPRHEEGEGVFPEVIANQLRRIHQNISRRQGRRVSLENSSLADSLPMEVQPLQLIDNSTEVNVENVGSSNTNLSDQRPEILSSSERQRRNKRSRQLAPTNGESIPTVLEDGEEAKGNDNFALQDDNLDDDEEEAEAEEESQQESEHETSARLKASAKSANTPESQVIGLPITPPQKRRPIGCVGTFTRVLKQATECVITLVFEKQRILFDNLTEEDQLNATTTFINACASDDQLELVKA